MSAVTATASPGVSAVSANSTGSVSSSYPSGASSSTKRYDPRGRSATSILPLPSVVRRSEPSTAAQEPSACWASSLNTAPGRRTDASSASTFVSVTLPTGGTLAFSAVRLTTTGAGAAASMENPRGVSSST